MRLVMLAGALVLAGASALPAERSPVPRSHAVTIQEMAFKPAQLSVAVGDTVVWTNQDVVPHSATAKGTWDTGTLSQGQSGSYVAKATGEFEYVCTLHPGMKGAVVVK